MPLFTTFIYFLVEGFREPLSTQVVHALFKGGDVFPNLTTKKGLWLGLS
jgi:hypothetical protein